MEVKATLPSYVKWLGIISPSTEKVSYNTTTGEVVWNVGNISPGFGEKVREVEMQISLLPSLSQVGSSPELLSDSLLGGEDDFTGSQLQTSSRRLNTRITTDPIYLSQYATVVQ